MSCKTGYTIFVVATLERINATAAKGKYMGHWPEISGVAPYGQLKQTQSL